MFNNMRKYRRYPIFAKVEIRTKRGGSADVTIAQVNSISETGLGIYSSERIEAGAEVSISIEFISFKGEQERDFVEGVIAWTRKEDIYYHAGILFNKPLDREKQPKLFIHFHRFIKDD